MAGKTKIVIMGAAGRDFHNFNMVFRDNPRYEVVAFTATQIPNIEGRYYPSALAGSLYPQGIPIRSEEELDVIIRERRIDQVVFAYSDISHEEVMHKASRVMAAGADFRLLGPHSTMLLAQKPVVSICAVRTGAGKSPASRAIAGMLKNEGLRTAVIRHPMPYGELAKQAVQRFASLEDLRTANCTIEEMEEYEPHIRQRNVVYAGVDYEQILRKAEAESDVILWDGGNNDYPFFVADLEIVLVDPHRAGDEQTFFPGEVNLLRADVIILTKLDTAPDDRVAWARANLQAANPKAILVNSAMPVKVEDPERITGSRVLVVEDGPTLTHGGMRFGAGMIAAEKYDAAEVVDPRPHAVGSLKETFLNYPRLVNVLPAMGYGPHQILELEETIRNVDCDLVLIATPVDLKRIISIRQPTSRVTYEFQEMGVPTMREVLDPLIKKAKAHA